MHILLELSANKVLDFDVSVHFCACISVLWAATLQVCCLLNKSLWGDDF